MAKRRNTPIGPLDVQPLNRVRAGRPHDDQVADDVARFRIQNRAEDDTTEIWVYDEIGYWGVSAARFVQQLRGVDTGRIDLRLNSPGGDVYDGIAIMNALVAHDAEVTVYVDGLAASAASFIAQAGDRVVMRKHAEMMIHLPWGLTIGDAADHRNMADDLDRIGRNIASIYAERAGGEVDGWYEAMRVETWYSAEEAVEAGLADEVAAKGEPAATGAWDLSVYSHAGRAAAPPPFIPTSAAEERERLASIAVVNRGGDPEPQRPMTADRRNLPTEVVARLAERGMTLGVVDRAGRLVENTWFRPLVRADTERRTASVSGYGTVYGVPYEVAGGPDAGGWIETVEPGAAAKSLDQGADVRFLVNHEGFALARHSPAHDTMQVRSDSTGLHFHVPALDLGSPAVLSLVSAMQRGDMDEMSFLFRAIRQEWSDNYTRRRIFELAVYDVSLVNFGSNSAASGQIRNSPAGPSLELLEMELAALDL